MGIKSIQKPSQKTDSNSYLPPRSCHYPKWVGNIPKGQIMRIKRNCNLEEKDFEETSNKPTNLLNRVIKRSNKKKKTRIK